jgi:hypothetical protein
MRNISKFQIWQLPVRARRWIYGRDARYGVSPDGPWNVDFEDVMSHDPRTLAMHPPFAMVMPSPDTPVSGLFLPT